MKRNAHFNSLLFIATYFLYLSMGCSYDNSNQTINIDQNIEKNIRTNKLSSRLMIVSFGTDAVTAFTTKKGIVVIDAGISNSLSTKYRERIEKEFSRKDFIYLINTHSHFDHTGGNQVFSDIKIIGHENCLTEMSEYHKNPGKTRAGLLKTIENYNIELQNYDTTSIFWKEPYVQKLKYQQAYNDLLTDRKTVNPNLTFKDTLNILLGDVTLNMIYFGKAHTESDIIIHIPELRLLFTGDLFFKGGKPSFNLEPKKDPRWFLFEQWLKERWAKIDLVIGGHGQIMNKDDLNAFLNHLREANN